MDRFRDPPCDEHQFRLGHLEAQAESLSAALMRIEAKLDSALIRHDERLRAVEGEMTALKRIGTIIAVVWGTVVAGMAYMFQRQS